MTQARSTLSIKQNFWFRTCESTYDFSVDLGREDFAPLFHQTITSLVPQAASTLTPLMDLKGREPNSIIDNSIAPSHRPNGFELLFVSGLKHALKDPDNSVEWDDEVEPTPFIFRVNTPFLEFKGNHHILHSIELERSESVAELKILDLFDQPTLEVKSFRFGLDLFKSSFSAMLGFTPTVKESLMLECTRERFLLQLVAEGLKNRDDSPILLQQAVTKLDPLISKITNSSISDDYRAKSSW